MTTATMEGRLATIGRRIDALYPHASAREVDEKPRIQRHVDALLRKEASARASVRAAYEQSRRAVSEYADSVDYWLRLLEIELDVAETSLRAELAEDAAAFADAVESELNAFDAYLERLQVQAATRGGSTRTEAEDAIRDLGRLRNAFAHRLQELPESSSGGWRETKSALEAARAELERAIDDVSPKFD